MIQEIIEKMRHLQDLLLQKFSSEELLEQLPRSLDTKQEMVDRLKISQSEKKLKHEEMLRKISSNRQALEELEKQREHDERTISLITTQREYEALDREIQNSTVKEQGMRKDILRMEKEIAELVEELKREEALIISQEETLVQERHRVEQETKVHLRRLEDLNKKEHTLTQGIDDEMLFKFERIVRRKGSKGIVPVRGVVCTGCHMILPNQFVNEIRNGNQILFCPYCSRILFYTEDSVKTPGDQPEIGGLASLFEDDESMVDEELDILDDDLEEDTIDDEEKVEDIDGDEDDLDASDDDELQEEEEEEDFEDSDLEDE